MGSAPGHLSLESLLAAERSDVDLLALVDLLESGALSSALPPHSERVSFLPSTSLGFAGQEIPEIDVSAAGRASLRAAFFGLCGGVSPLPLSFAEEFDADDEFGETARALLSVVQDHLTRLLVDVSRYTDPARERSRDTSGSWISLALAWLSLDRASATIPADLRSRLSPLIATGLQSREVVQEALRVVVEDLLLDADLHVQAWAGTWTAIPQRQVLRLSTATAYLGQGAILGGRCVHLDGKARVCVGPLTTEQLPDFARDGPAYLRIAALLREVLPEPLRWDLSLEVEMAPEERCRLGERRLSEDLWLQSDETSMSRTVQIVLPLN